MEKPYDHLKPLEEEPSSEEITSSLFNFLVTGSFFIFYLSLSPLGLFRSLFYVSLFNFLSYMLAIIIDKKTMVEFLDPHLEQEPCYTQSSEEEMVILFNVLIIGSILLFYLSLVFPLGLFRGLCNFVLFGFFSLTIMMIFIFADDPKIEASWLLSNKIDKDERKPGDHIYTWRGGYAHHGICAEDGNVIHFVRGARQGYGIETGLHPFISNSSPSHSKDNRTKSCTSCGDQSNLSGVISSCIKCFLSRGDLYLFQYSVTPTFFLAKVRGGTCTLVASDPLEVVLNRAKALLCNNSFGVYHILMNNCESFAYYCKTNLSFFSGQVVSFLAGALFLTFQLLYNNPRSLGVAVVMGFSAHCACRFATGGGAGDHCLKAPVERLRLWMLWKFGFLILQIMILVSLCLDVYSSL